MDGPDGSFLWMTGPFLRVSFKRVCVWLPSGTCVSQMQMRDEGVSHSEATSKFVAMDLRGVVVLLVVLMASAGVQSAAAAGRPDPSDAPGMARWLVSFNDWGVLSTISVHLGGSPWGNIASFSDGPPGNSSGTIFFYLSKLDPTPNDLDLDPRCSFSLSESPLGTCGGTDAENPTCARLTLTGKMEEVTSEEELDFAATALFTKHPEMQGWPKWHHFIFYKLVITDIFLIDNYGGAKPLTVEEYYNGSTGIQVPLMVL